MNFNKDQEYYGKVKWFNKKGFGVINVNDCEETVFVHHSNIITKSKKFIFLEENEDVIFHVEEINGKNSALKVQPVNENFIFETKNGNLETNFNKNKKRRRRKKNTESFEPSFIPSDMRIISHSSLNEEKYSRDIYSNEIILINDLFGDQNNLDYYNKLLEEMNECGIKNEDLWKLWHGDTHLIADDKKNWKECCPTFRSVIEKIRDYFNMDIKATRFNWYKDSSQWKPYHHDAAAIKPDKAKVQNITVGVSFGSERDVSFQHAKKRTVVSIPLVNNSIYCFNKDVNIEWRHGIPQLPENLHNDQGRISIIAWGKVDMNKKY